MMRGERTWAVAVRTPEGDIEIETHEAPTWAERWSKIPLLRGRHGARRVDGARLQGAGVVGEPADPRRGADLEQGDGLDDRRRAHVLHSRSSSCCPRSRRTASATSSASTASGSTSPRARCASSIFLGYLLAHRPAPRHQARVPVPRRRAQGDRRLRERRRGHRRVRAAVRHRARALRHQLPAHGDGGHHRRVLVRRAGRAGRCSSAPASC